MTNITKTHKIVTREGAIVAWPPRIMISEGQMAKLIKEVGVVHAAFGPSGTWLKYDNTDAVKRAIECLAGGALRVVPIEEEVPALTVH